MKRGGSGSLSAVFGQLVLNNVTLVSSTPPTHLLSISTLGQAWSRPIYPTGSLKLSFDKLFYVKLSNSPLHQSYYFTFPSFLFLLGLESLYEQEEVKCMS